MAAKVLLGAAIVVLAMAMSGCTSGCSSATPGSSGGASSGSAGGATHSPGACTPAGGGNPGANGTPAAFAYYENQGTIGATMVDTSGNFGQLVGFANPPSSLQALGILLTVQQKWLYEVVGLQIKGYSIASGTGALTDITGSPFSLSGTEVASLATDATGKFVFVLAANNDQVEVLSVDQTSGALAPVGTFATAGFAAQATTDGLGKYLYVTEGNSGTMVEVYTIASTGQLTPIAGSPFLISIATLRSEPTGKFLLGVTGDGVNNGRSPGDNHVYIFSIDQTSGALSVVPGSPFTTTFIPADLAVHPNGTLVYTFNGTVSGTSPATPVEGFQLDTSSGALTPLAGSPFAGMIATSGFFDQSGAFLFLHPTGSIEVAAVDPTTGALTAIGSPVTGVGNSTQAWAVTDPH